MRIKAIDNIKAILILCVVYGHALEIFTFPESTYLYLIIYSFHVPVFVFISGLCSRKNFSPDKITKHYILPYLIFQILYTLFYIYVLDLEWTCQFIQPIWMLWYLVALILWNISIHFIPANNISLPKKILILTGTVIVSLLAGFDQKIGYDFSLSRTIVLFPFFLLGRFAKDYTQHIFAIPETKKRCYCLVKSCSLLLVVLLCLFLFKNRTVLGGWMFYHTSPYSEVITLKTRLFSFGFALVFLVFFCLFIPNKKIPALTYLGQNTMPVFILHGFILQYLKYNTFPILQQHPAFASIAVTLMIMLIFSVIPYWKKRITQSLV